MAQSSGPISQGTTAERQFTDVQWRDLFGDEPGVIGDLDGSAYALNLSGGGDVVNVGSATQASLAKVAGFFHRISQGSTEPITIPTASGSTRTDIIGLRYDPAYTGLPGPVRLYRTIGSSASIPAYDSSPPGVEDLPLWAITRAVGQPLSLATVQRLFPRISNILDAPSFTALPTSSPLGTVVWVGDVRYRRELVAGTPTWVVSAAGKWITAYQGSESYSHGATGSATTLPGLSGSVVVPVGRTLEVDVHIPRMNVPNGGGIFLRLVINGVIKRVAAVQTGSSTSLASPAYLHASEDGTGLSMSFLANCYGAGSGGSIQGTGDGAANGGPVLRYRIVS